MAAETLTIESIKHLRVANMDPLRLDGPLGELPKYNESADVPRISEITAEAVEAAGRLDTLYPETASACLRDLDFLASSLLRHGVEPMQAIDGLEGTMLRMGGAAGTVPRSTITTYAGANPSGDRRRSFTGSAEEDMFIDGLSASYERLETATHALSRIDLSDASARHALIAALRATSIGMGTMIGSIVDVHRRITPTYFTNVMRPYFDPLTIGGEQYSAAGGGQLQLVALEAMLWGSDDSDAEWRSFYEENYPYLSPAQRNALGFFEAQNGGRSVLSRIGEEAEAGSVDLDVVASLEEVMRKIRKFRYPHRKVAEDNFTLRPPEAVGSGSYTPAILGVLIVKTEANLGTLGEMKQ